MECLAVNSDTPSSVLIDIPFPPLVEYALPHAIDCRQKDCRQIGRFPKAIGQSRVAENPDPFYVVIKLLPSQRSHDGRDLAQRPVAVFLRIIDVHFDLDLSLHRGGIEEDFVRCHHPSQSGACRGGEVLRAGGQHG